MIKKGSKTLVGVTQRIDNIADRGEFRDALDQRLVHWLVYAGFLPIPIPNFLSTRTSSTSELLESWLQFLQPHALILSGGNDIGEYTQRDTTEHYLLSWAKAKRVPVLGICHGLQMMAAWSGADLVRIEGHVGSRHQLVIPNRKDEWPTHVNSYHDWSLDSCPERFEVSTRAEDGSIESIKHIDLPWEGWMWHPEREVPFTRQDTARIKRLFCGK